MNFRLHRLHHSQEVVQADIFYWYITYASALSIELQGLPQKGHPHDLFLAFFKIANSQNVHPGVCCASDKAPTYVQFQVLREGRKKKFRGERWGFYLNVEKQNFSAHLAQILLVVEISPVIP